jgi:predicted dehydrogenase/threonine dehydrogenase-like Zn-dependent dehydrogenase
LKQVLQNISNGQSMFVTAPSPYVAEGKLLIATVNSLISTGTERMIVDFAKSSIFDKVRQQPEKVKQVLEKVKTEGLMTTVDAIRSKLSQPFPLGYCNVGVVIGVGRFVAGFQLGDRVVSNGPHADVVHISAALCARIPESVDDESAVFTVLASIGLQGIRLAQPTLGEAIVVTGAGLIGLLTIQLLKAQGCRVLTIDMDDKKLLLAQQFGAEICNPLKGEDPVAAGLSLSRGRGVDAVIITASTKSSDPVSQAAKMSRKRGRIVLVGVTGLELNRADFYEKELTFQVSCSYGPGRYDPAYEEKGFDYPIGFVRWTEQRNFEAVLDLMAAGQLNLQPLTSHRFAFEDADKAYDVLTEDRSALGIMLNYTTDVATRVVKDVPLRDELVFDGGKPILGFIGAGNYASRILMPAFKAMGVQLHTVVTSGGMSGAIHGQTAGFAYASTDFEKMLSNEVINTIVIVTRHHTHARFVSDALAHGKHVFVEKPLAIHFEELEAVQAAYLAAQSAGKSPHLMIGFNRRFAPQVQKMKALLQTVTEPKSIIMTVNAGAIPLDHWTQDRAIGGGRIIGEACHFIDLMRHLVGARIVSVQARVMGQAPGLERVDDKAAIILGFADGSFGTIHYLANGTASFPKERIEVFTAGRILQLDNFRKLRGFGWPGFKKMNLWRQDKGQKACAAAFIQAIEKRERTPIPAEEIFEVTLVSIEVAEMLARQS